MPRLTEDEYLRIEREAGFKSEFFEGQMFAMAGGSPKHSSLGVNAIGELYPQLKGTHCRLHSSDLRLRTPNGAYHYPDLSVVCGPLQLHPGTSDVMINPVLLVEVLSPSTASHDRGAKFEMYRLIPTLLDFVVIHQKSIFVEHYTKSPDGSWVLRECRGGEARIPLPNIKCELNLGNVYEDVLHEAL